MGSTIGMEVVAGAMTAAVRAIMARAGAAMAAVVVGAAATKAVRPWATAKTLLPAR